MQGTGKIKCFWRRELGKIRWWRQKGDIFSPQPFNTVWIFLHVRVLLLQGREHLPKQKTCSYVTACENGMISVNVCRWSRDSSGGIVHRVIYRPEPLEWWGRAHPVGIKTNAENLYEATLMSKYWGSWVGVEVVGGAIKSRYFRFMLFLIWVTVEPMFCQYLLLIFAPEWRKDAQAQHKYEGGTERYEKRKELTLKWNHFKNLNVKVPLDSQKLLGHVGLFSAPSCHSSQLFKEI